MRKPLLDAFGLPGGTVRLPRLAISLEQLGKVIEATVRLQIPDLSPLVATRP